MRPSSRNTDSDIINSNMYRDSGDLSQQSRSELRLSVTVQRLGGAQFGWLAVLGLLLIGSIIGTIQSCLGGPAVDFDAQDAVNLLQSTLNNRAIRDTTRVQHRDGMVVSEMGLGPQSNALEVKAVHSNISARDTE